MRRLFVLLAAGGLLIPAAQAQTERGSKLLGVSAGQLSYARYRYNSGSAVSASLYPSAGYFVANNLAVGAELYLNYSRQRSRNSYLGRQAVLGLGPFVRYYVPGQGRHRVFAEVGADVSRTRRRDIQYQPGGTEVSNDLLRYSLFTYHGAVGYTYFVTPTLALESSVGYYQRQGSGLVARTKSLDIQFGFAAYLPAGSSN